MATITSLTPQKSKKRVNVSVDGKFSFGIDLDNLVILKIKIGNEYSEKELEEIIRKAEFQKVLDRLLVFATLRPRSEKEVRDYLKRKKVHESFFEDLFKKLRYLDLQDDEKFAKWWVDQRIQFKKKSKKALEFELRSKGIDRQIIEKILSETEVDEGRLAKELIAKRLSRWQKFDAKTRKQKIIQYLSSKGFSWDVIEKVVKSE